MRSFGAGAAEGVSKFRGICGNFAGRRKKGRKKEEKASMLTATYLLSPPTAEEREYREH